MEEEQRLDSFTIGTAAKNGAVKFYFNAQSETAEEQIKKGLQAVAYFKKLGWT